MAPLPRFLDSRPMAAANEDLLAGDRQIDPALLAQLETALLAADLGVGLNDEISSRSLGDNGSSDR